MVRCGLVSGVLRAGVLRAVCVGAAGVLRAGVLRAVSGLSALQATSPAAVFNAAFRIDGVEVRADIVTHGSDGGVEIFEVKSGTKVKPRHVKDVAFQIYAIERSGFEVKKATILHLNSQYRH